MAERPIFVPSKAAPGLVQEISMTIPWHGGFAPSQKKKNVLALHAAAAKVGYDHVLEISTKSEDKVGQRLSAFNLKVLSASAGELPLESAYQGSKIFEGGGPFTDLFSVDARTSKRDLRLKNSGKLIGFVFDGHRFPLEPETAFYNWLYIKAIYPHRGWLRRLEKYSAFTDIEFNPGKSINCQARACAYFFSLMNLDLLDDDLMSPECFISVSRRFAFSGLSSVELGGREQKNNYGYSNIAPTNEANVSAPVSSPIRDQRQLEMILDT